MDNLVLLFLTDHQSNTLPNTPPPHNHQFSFMSVTNTHQTQFTLLTDPSITTTTGTSIMKIFIAGLALFGLLSLVSAKDKCGRSSAPCGSKNYANCGRDKTGDTVIYF